MAGALVLAGALCGTMISGTANADTSPVQSALTLSPDTDVARERAVDDVEISRGFDRVRYDEQIADQMAQREAALKEVDSDVQDRAKQVEVEQQQRAEKRRERNQWVLPVAGYQLTARFGQSSSMWSSGSHTGLDFAGPSGSEISSIATGTVKSADYEGSYGNRTVITLLDGTEVWYCHQSSMSVEVGDKVDAGQSIGSTGATGNVTGPHLHLEVHPGGGDAVNPESELTQHDVQP